VWLSYISVTGNFGMKFMLCHDILCVVAVIC